MAIIESWYYDDRKLFSLPITHRVRISRGITPRAGKDKILVRDEDTVTIRRQPERKMSYTIDAPPFVTEVDELLRLRHLPQHIHTARMPRKKPSEQELYQDAINIGGGIAARRFGRLHSRVTWQTSFHDDPMQVADRLIWRYPPMVSAWIAKVRTIFQYNAKPLVFPLDSTVLVWYCMYS